MAAPRRRQSCSDETGLPLLHEFRSAMSNVTEFDCVPWRLRARAKGMAAFNEVPSSCERPVGTHSGELQAFIDRDRTRQFLSKSGRSFSGSDLPSLDWIAL